MGFRQSRSSADTQRGRGLYRPHFRHGNRGGFLVAERLYLDHAATTPVIAAARAAVAQGFERWANPSSPHAPGRAARAVLEDARRRIATSLDWDGEVILTSGASEAIQIAIGRAKDADAVLLTTVEHDAVRRAGGASAYNIPVGDDGVVAADALTGRLGALAAKRPLVAIQTVNNETGVIQPLDRLGPVVRAAGGILFADASQSAGKLPLPDADLIAISGHKLGGPPGIGALLVRDLASLEASGGQEQGYRSGTENLPGALGFAAALEAPHGWTQRADDLRAHCDAAIEAAGGDIVARNAPRFGGIASYRMPGVPSAAQLIQFDMAGIAVSSGSACSSGTLKSSQVLAAMGWHAEPAGEVIRVSFGPETSRADVYRFVDCWRRIAGKGE